MARQSIATQQNFNAEELAEEKELFSDSDDSSLPVHELQHDDFLGVEMAVYSD